MEKDSVLHLIKKADWKDIILKLTYYAIQRAKIYKWISGEFDRLLGGKTPEDIACEAIEKVLSGTRAWDPDKYPNLLTHLKWIVKSDMDHLASSLEHQTTGRMPLPVHDEEGPVDYYKIIPDQSSPTPEEVLITREKKELEEKLKNDLYALVEGDKDLEELLLYFDEGIDKPETIAAQSGWDISKVYNLKRKLLRKASKLRVNTH
jgi:hypothetical protein